MLIELNYFKSHITTLSLVINPLQVKETTENKFIR